MAASCDLDAREIPIDSARGTRYGTLAVRSKLQSAFRVTGGSGGNEALSRQWICLGNRGAGRWGDALVLTVLIERSGCVLPGGELPFPRPAISKDGRVCLLLVNHGVILDYGKIASPHKQE